ncbi:low molecular weight phosphotyrosine protein phosphatase [Trinickia terrae]|uniref:protein-tyrosine-phosphatase n=1 Tax=Trinickia terrae TaxID=2571161 RepID=A0A4V5PJ97_9BURK|nr:low molecular weight protein-tyrosine-phosphatase [Trinickia terrae]TKC85870.1 low molecular weight phosphotyrosine protein phosphatase [Trinickia terrae]
MFKNILVVCHANICRSPAAELLFRARRPHGQIRFHSAGLKACDGASIDSTMQRLLAHQGIDSSDHRSRRLSPQLIRDADLILVSERKQITAVESLAPTSRGKVHLLGKWEDSDVADPYGDSEDIYRKSFALIEHLVTGWLNKIC